MDGIGNVLLLLFLAAPFALCVLLLASWWTIFDKMGEKGWKILIPFYGSYVFYRSVWESRFYFVCIALRGVSSFLILYWAIPLSLSIAAGASTGFILGSLGVLLFAVIFAFAAFILQIMAYWRLVKCFGHSFGYFLGIIFLPVIFIPMLAFGGSYFDYY